MDVYLDLVVLLNFLVDWLLLCGSSKLCGYPINQKRLVPASALGAVYAGLCLLPGWRFLAGGVWHLLVFGIMGAVGYGLNKGAIRRIVVFFLLSMALGGLATGMGSGGVWTLALASAGLWFLCRLGFGGSIGSSYVSVTILHGGQKLQLTALVDTGNSLHDPLSGRPVLVAREEVAGKLLGLSAEQLKNPIQTMGGGAYKGLRLIPYHTVGVSGGFLLAFSPEEVWIDGKKGNHLVAFAPNKIGQGQAFEALAGGNV